MLRKVDYYSAGFERIGTVEQRPGDDSVHALSYLRWDALARLIEFELTGVWPTGDDEPGANASSG